MGQLFDLLNPNKPSTQPIYPIEPQAPEQVMPGQKPDPEAEKPEEEGPLLRLLNKGFDARQERDAIDANTVKPAPEVRQDNDLSNKSGLSLEAVEADRDAVKQHIKVNELDDKTKDAPRTRDMLTNSAIGPAVADDTDTLVGLEYAFNRLRDFSGDMVSTLMGMSLEGLGDLYNITGRNMEDLLASSLRGVGLEGAADIVKKTPDVPWWIDPGEILRQPGKTLKEKGRELHSGEDSHAAAIAGGLGQLTGQVVLYMLTGGTVSTLSMIGQGVSIGTERGSKEKLKSPVVDTLGEQVSKDLHAVSSGAITALTERVGLEKILKRFSWKVRKGVHKFLLDLSIAGGIEAVQEVAEGAMHDLATIAILNPDAEILKEWDREAIAGGGAAGIFRTLTNALIKGRSVHAEHQMAKKAEIYKERLTEIMETAGQSPIKAEFPELFQEVIERLTEETDSESIMVNAAGVETFFQAAGTPEKAVEFFEEVGIETADVHRAMRLGTDLEIKTGKFMEAVQGMEFQEGVLMNTRADAGSLTMAEVEVRLPELEAKQKNIVEEVRADLEGTSDNAKVLSDATLVREDFTEKARRAGATRPDLHGLVVESMFLTAYKDSAADVAEGREGAKLLDVADFYRSMNLRITREQFADYAAGRVPGAYDEAQAAVLETKALHDQAKKDFTAAKDLANEKANEGLSEEELEPYFLALDRAEAERTEAENAWHDAIGAREKIRSSAIPISDEMKAELEQQGQDLFGPEILSVKGTGPHGKILIKDIAKAFNSDHKRKHRRQFFPEKKKGDYQKVLEMAKADFGAQLQEANSGVGWYSIDVENAIKLTAKLYPTLLTTPGHRDLWLTFAGIFSNGMDPSDAWTAAAGAFDLFLETGEIPVKREHGDGTPVELTTYKDKKGKTVTTGKSWGPRGNVNTQHLEFVKFLVEREGSLEAGLRWLFDTHPRNEINAAMTDSGLWKAKFPRYIQKDLGGPDVYGSLAVGKKLGRYILGLQGVEIDATDTTIDVWYVRSFRRWTGRLFESPVDPTTGVVGQPLNDTERDVIFKLTGDLAREFNLEPGDVQAVLWFFEKRLWAEHGGVLDEGTNSQGAKNLFEKRGLKVPKIRNVRGRGAAARRKGGADVTGELYQQGAPSLTPEFQRWFEGSQVVGATGRPMIMYHGTQADIRGGFSDLGALYFTENAQTADRFARDPRGMVTAEEEGYEPGANINPVYLKVEEMFDPQDKSDLEWLIQTEWYQGREQDLDEKFGDPSSWVETDDMDLFNSQTSEWELKDREGHYFIDSVEQGDYNTIEESGLLDLLRDAGFDGWRFTEKSLFDSVGVFSADQVRSAMAPADLFQGGDQTLTPEFRQWFGNSEVVDEMSGQPVVVYHGTTVGEVAGDMETGVFPRTRFAVDKWIDTGHPGDIGEWFTESPEVANQFAQRENAHILPVYISMQNAMHYETYEDLESALAESDLGGLGFQNSLKEQGYDGIIIDYSDTDAQLASGRPIERRDFIAFSNDQIRSAMAPADLFQRDDISPLGFYSKAARAVRSNPQKKATAEQWRSHLDKKNVKQEEIDWIVGLDEFFDSAKGKSIKQEDLAQFIEGHGIAVREVVLDQGDGSRTFGENYEHQVSVIREREEYQDGAELGVDQTLVRVTEVEDGTSGEGFIVTHNIDADTYHIELEKPVWMVVRHRGDTEQLSREGQSVWTDDQAGAEAEVHNLNADLRTPRGEDHDFYAAEYRQTLPIRPVLGAQLSPLEFIDVRNIITNYLDAKYRDLPSRFPERHGLPAGKPKWTGGTMVRRGPRKRDREIYLTLPADASPANATIKDWQITGGHRIDVQEADERLVVRIRLNERTDLDGTRTLYIEEIQAERQRAGQEEGWGDPREQHPDWTRVRIAEEELRALDVELHREGLSIDPDWTRDVYLKNEPTGVIHLVDYSRAPDEKGNYPGINYWNVENAGEGVWMGGEDLVTFMNANKYEETYLIPTTDGGPRTSTPVDFWQVLTDFVESPEEMIAISEANKDDPVIGPRHTQLLFLYENFMALPQFKDAFDFSKDRDDRQVLVYKNTAYNALDKRHEQQWNVTEELNDLRDKLRFEEADEGVPPMPFRMPDAWLPLALKRLIRLAAEENYDQIAWITGEEQAARWQRVSKFDEVEYEKVDKPEPKEGEKKEPDRWNLRVKYKDDIIKEFGRDKIAVARDGSFTLEKGQLVAMLGKDTANQILKDEGVRPDLPRIQSWRLQRAKPVGRKFMYDLEMWSEPDNKGSIKRVTITRERLNTFIGTAVAKRAITELNRRERMEIEAVVNSEAGTDRAVPGAEKVKTVKAPPNQTVGGTGLRMQYNDMMPKEADLIGKNFGQGEKSGLTQFPDVDIGKAMGAFEVGETPVGGQWFLRTRGIKKKYDGQELSRGRLREMTDADELHEVGVGDATNYVEAGGTVIAVEPVTPSKGAAALTASLPQFSERIPETQFSVVESTQGPLSEIGQFESVPTNLAAYGEGEATILIFDRAEDAEAELQNLKDRYINNDMAIPQEIEDYSVKEWDTSEDILFTGSEEAAQEFYEQKVRNINEIQIGPASYWEQNFRDPTKMGRGAGLWSGDDGQFHVGYWATQGFTIVKRSRENTVGSEHFTLKHYEDLREEYVSLDEETPEETIRSNELHEILLALREEIRPGIKLMQRSLQNEGFLPEGYRLELVEHVDAVLKLQINHNNLDRAISGDVRLDGDSDQNLQYALAEVLIKARDQIRDMPERRFRDREGEVQEDIMPGAYNPIGGLASPATREGMALDGPIERLLQELQTGEAAGWPERIATHTRELSSQLIDTGYLNPNLSLRVTSGAAGFRFIVVNPSNLDINIGNIGTGLIGLADATVETTAEALTEILYLTRDTLVELPDLVPRQAIGDQRILTAIQDRVIVDDYAERLGREDPEKRVSGFYIVPEENLETFDTQDEAKARRREVSARKHAFDAWAFPITDELKRVGLEEGFPFLGQDDEGRSDPLGAFSGRDPTALQIRLFEGADLSTLLHETGHLFVHILERLATRDGAAQRTIENYNAMLDWVGATSSADLDVTINGDAAREKQEKLANAFEAYLKEGKAPNKSLKRAFAQFRQWLVSVYEQLIGRRLTVEIDDEVRRIFDRMLATDAEIAEMTEFAHMDVNASPSIQALMSPEERALHTELVALADEEASNTQRIEDERIDLEAQQDIWDADKEKMKKDIEEEIWKRPPYRALWFLTQGEFKDEGTPAGHEKRRLDKKALEEMGLSKEEIKALPRYKNRVIYTNDPETATDPEFMAVLLGFDSAREMIDVLSGMMPVAEAVETEADIEMRGTRGDPLDTGQREKIVEEAIYSEERRAAIQAELDALARKTGQAAVGRQLVKDIVDEVFATRPVGELLTPMRYQSAAVRAAREAERAAANGDWMTAFHKKRLHLLNHELFRRGLEARTEVQKITKRLNDKKRKKLDPKKYDGDMIASIKNLLQFYQVGAMSLKKFNMESQVVLASSVMNHIQQQREAGAPVILPGDLVELVGEDADGNPQFAFKTTHWRQMTLLELRGLDDMIKNLAHIGKLRSEAEKGRLRSWAQELVESIEKNTRRRKEKKTGLARPTDEQLKKETSKHGFYYDHRKLESLLRQLDGFEDLGPMWQAIFSKIAEGRNERNRMVEKIMNDMDEIFGAYSFNERRKIKSDKSGVAIELLGGKVLTQEQRLMIALNWGNESSREALMQDSDFIDRYGDAWTEDAVQEILNTLSSKDLDVVEKIFETVNQFWPQIAALERRQTGVIPKKVEAAPFEVNGREMKGGYFPLQYDGRLSSRVAIERQEDLLKSNQFGGFSHAATRHGFTNARVGSGGRPITLSINVLMNHLEDVSQDLAFREAVIQAGSLMRQDSLRQAIVDTVGQVGYDRMMEILVKVASGGHGENLGPVLSFFKMMRLNASAAIMGANIRVILTQPLGLSQSIERIGTGRMMQGLTEFWMHPTRSIREIHEQSTFMRERGKMLTRELDDISHKIEIPKISEKVKEWGFRPIVWIDVIAVAYPTWLGAKAKAMAGKVKHVEAEDEAAAIQYADSVVRLTQGTGAPENLSMIQQRDELHKDVTMFGSYFNTTMNIQSEALEKAALQTERGKPARAAGNLIYTTSLLSIIPAIMAGILLERTPTEDEEDEHGEVGAWVRWYFLMLLNHVGAQVFIVRDLINAAVTQFDYSFTPIESWVSSLIRAGKEIPKIPEYWEEGEFPAKFFKNVARALGYWKGVPGANQIIRTFDTYHKMEEDDMKHPPKNRIDAVKKLLLTGDR